MFASSRVLPSVGGFPFRRTRASTSVVRTPASLCPSLCSPPGLLLFLSTPPDLLPLPLLPSPTPSPPLVHWAPTASRRLGQLNSAGPRGPDSCRHVYASRRRWISAPLRSLAAPVSTSSRRHVLAPPTPSVSQVRLRRLRSSRLRGAGAPSTASSVSPVRLRHP